MRGALLFLGGLVLALAGTEAWLAGRDARAREDAVRIGTLFTPEEVAELRRQPALRVELPGATHEYGRVDGEWRCLTLHGAPADARAIGDLLDGLLRLEGLVRSRDVDEAPRYGINVPSTVRVSIQGQRARSEPGGDVLATVELGSPVASGGSFVRRRGERAIWSVDADLRAALERRVAPGLPPLLQAGAVPPGPLEEGGGLERVAVREGASAWSLARRPRAPGEAGGGAAAGGAPPLPWEWVLSRDGTETVVDDGRGQGFAAFVSALPYADVLDPAERTERVPAPAATVTLATRSGTELALELGPPGDDGRVPLWVPATSTLYLVTPQVLALTVQAPERLLAPAGDGPDPWTAYLTREERR